MIARETSLATGVRMADASLDAVCKRLLGDRQVVARILVDAVSGFEGADPDALARECVEADPSYDVPLARDTTAGPKHMLREHARQNPVESGPDTSDVTALYTDGTSFADRGPALRLDTDDTTSTEGKAIFDVRTRAVVPGTLEIVELGLEGQGKASPGYPLLRRAMYYCGRMLSQQGMDVVARSNYGALRRVVSIWVVLRPPEDLAGTVWRAQMDSESLVGNPPWNASDLDCVEIAVLCIGGDSRKHRGALGMLDVLFAENLVADEKLTILANEYGMMVTEEVEQEVQTMSSIGQEYLGKLRDSFERELADKVTQDVTAKVTRDNLIASVRTLMETLPTSATIALDLLRVGDDDREAVIAALNA